MSLKTPERIRINNERWRRKNGQHISEYHKLRYATRIDVRYRSCKRSHEKKNMIFDVSLEEYALAYDTKNCLICHQQLTGVKEWEYDYRGFVHHACNSFKGTRSIPEFKNLISDIYSRL